MSNKFEPSEAAKARPSKWAVEAMNWKEEQRQLAAKPSLIITAPKKTTWLRACRRVRYIVHELALIAINLAGAFAAVGIAWAIWHIIGVALERGTR